MWHWVVCVVGFALAAAGQETQTLNTNDTNEFPFEVPSMTTKNITGRSIFVMPLVVHCPDKYHYDSFYGRCTRRITVVRTEGQLLDQLNSLYGVRPIDQKPLGSFSNQKVDMKDRLSTNDHNFTLTHPGLRIRHSAFRKANKRYHILLGEGHRFSRNQ